MGTDRGEIYIETDAGFFPCFGWSDRLLSVLMLWIGNTLKMLDLDNGEQQTTNYFMNGPYSFDIQRVEKEYLVIKFMRNIGESGKREEMPPLKVALTGYCHALLNFAEGIVYDANLRQFGNEQERIHLQRSVALLRASIVRARL